jgi:FkbM family methyltransferase
VFSISKKCVKAILRRRRQKLEKTLASNVHALLDGGSLRMVDVGAAGGVLPRWYPYRSDISFIGLEPDQRSSAGLLQSEEARQFKDYQIIPYGAWDREGTISISFTRKPMCSSYFQPNVEFLRRFPEVNRFDITGSGDVQCNTLDNLLPKVADYADFIKLDLEGGELAVLQGAQNVLQTCLGLHVEVSFQYLRKNQPLFGDVSNFLEKKNIEFADFIYVSRWGRESYSGVGQCIFGDALFLRSPENVSNLLKDGVLEPAKIKAYLVILLVYERYDLALRMLDLVKGIKLDGGYVEKAVGVFRKRKHSFEVRLKRLEKINILVNSLNPNSTLHYLY